MSDDYDVRLQQVKERNKLIVGHFVHTWRGRISDDTLYQHVLNIEHFAKGYLNYYTEADGPRSLDQVTEWKVIDFITDWLPRKSLVTSARRVKNYLASFNKLFKFMGEHGYMAAEEVAEILQTLKDDRQMMIDAVVTYDDEPDESQSPEAFQARMQGLVERWIAIHQELKKKDKKNE
jgi:hypothetical protein